MDAKPPQFGLRALTRFARRFVAAVRATLRHMATEEQLIQRSKTLSDATVHKPFRFSVRDLMLSMACFATAMGWISLVVRLGGRDADLGDVVIVLALFPMLGTAIGGGIGLLFGDFWRGARTGLYFHLAVFVLMLISGVLFPSIQS